MFEITDKMIDDYYGEYERRTFSPRTNYDPDEFDYPDEYVDESYYYDELDEDLDALEAIQACEEVGIK